MQNVVRRSVDDREKSKGEEEQSLPINYKNRVLNRVEINLNNKSI
jgi:hypothetical protein